MGPVVGVSKSHSRFVAGAGVGYVVSQKVLPNDVHVAQVALDVDHVWPSVRETLGFHVDPGTELVVQEFPRQVEAKVDGARVRVEVEDDGPGAPPEIKDRIFEARFTTRSGRVEFGLGLGLPIARSIIRQHGGDITFNSQPGQTVFTVDLPEEPSTNHTNPPTTPSP